MSNFYQMTAEENFDATRVTAIEALTTYNDTVYATDQNYQGIQWDPVRRNLMYMYVENLPTTPHTNTTGYTLWDGEDSIAPGGAVDPAHMFNSYVGTKNIDTGAVTFYRNYDSTKTVPASIGGAGAWRRYTRDFQATGPNLANNGPGMTDPHTGNFWINGQSCLLYCFRRSDNYAQVISPMRPVIDAENILQIVGFNDDWAHVREIDETVADDDPSPVKLYLTPREFSSAEITADELLIDQTFTYPIEAPARYFHAYNREVFDHAGNMYLASCVNVGGKDFTLWRFNEDDGFDEITPWGASTGPNGDADDYLLQRIVGSADGLYPRTASIIPLYLPETDHLAVISKFFPDEHTVSSVDPALMFWSCTYVSDPSGTPGFDHHSAFVTGYMTADWEPTDIDGAAYAVIDAFEVNAYLGQSNYEYDIDYTKRWFFFLCTKMTNGDSDDKARIVLVEYQFTWGTAPSVVQVVDEQGWDDAYPDFEEDWDSNAFESFFAGDTAAVATAMQTIFNIDNLNPYWDVGIHDPETNSFWWSGGATDTTGTVPYFSFFDDDFLNRTKDVDGAPSTEIDPLLFPPTVGTTPPFLKLSFSELEPPPAESRRLRVWGYRLDGHAFYCLRVGESETLVFDLSTRQWASWKSPDRDNWRAHVGQNWIGMRTATFDRGFGSDVVAGDDASNQLWILDPTAGQDDDLSTGEPVPFDRIVVGGIPLDGREVAKCNAVTLDLALGEPVLDGATITLETSDDKGKSWVSHGTVTADTDDAVVEWRSLGIMRAPGRIFRITDNGATVRIGAADLR